jgi:ribosomal protein S11
MPATRKRKSDVAAADAADVAEPDAKKQNAALKVRLRAAAAASARSAAPRASSVARI